MYVKCYNSMDERKFKEDAEYYFEEASSGVYHVVKDRDGDYKEYVSSDDVMQCLNQFKVAVKGFKGLYANFTI